MPENFHERVSPEQPNKVEKQPDTPQQARERVEAVLKERIPKAANGIQQIVDETLKTPEFNALKPDEQTAYREAVNTAVVKYIEEMKGQIPLEELKKLDVREQVQNVLPK
jgi:hypothetical protein